MISLDNIDCAEHREIFRLNEAPRLSKINFVGIADDFYANPEAVREFALRSVYEDRGSRSYAGRNGLAPYPVNVETVLSNPAGRRFKPWSTTLRVNDIHDEPAQTQVHCDGQRGHLWAVVAYLNPDPPEHAGTEFYEFDGSPMLQEITDIRDWPRSRYQKLFTVPMRWNRAAIYNGKVLHTASLGFGDTLETARLVHSMMFMADQ